MKRLLTLVFMLTVMLLVAASFTGRDNNENEGGMSSLSDNISDDMDAEEDESEDATERNEIKDKMNEDNATDSTITYPTLLKSTSYSNDRAWVEYNYEHTTYIASIDKSGQEVFRIENQNISSYDNFSEEYAYLRMQNGDLSLINKSGSILYSVSESSTNSILAYGGGYVLCERYEDGFDYSRYLYEVYDANGDIHEIDIGGKYGEANYCGNGVFGISLRGSWDWTVTFYNAEKRQWILPASASVTGDINIQFDNGIACFGIKYYDPDDVGYRSALRIISPDGWWETPLLMGWSYNDYGAGYHDGVVILSESDGYIYCYFLESGEYTQLAGKYASKALEGDFKDRTGFYSKTTGFKNDRFVLKMKGSDSRSYFGIFDKQWNAVLEPTTYDEIVGFDGFRLVIVQNGETLVYDENGNKLFSAKEINVDTISAYNDGVAMVSVGKYIDRNGNFLFDDILFLQQ